MTMKREIDKSICIYCRATLINTDYAELYKSSKLLYIMHISCIKEWYEAIKHRILDDKCYNAVINTHNTTKETELYIKANGYYHWKNNEV